MDGPANTINYMIAGYVVILGTLLTYIISLFLRWRKLKLEEQNLQELLEED